MSNLEQEVIALEQLAERLKALQAGRPEKSWASEGGIGDQVSGIQVVGPDGEIKKEWHNEKQ